MADDASRPTDHLQPAAKKRASDRELNKDNASDSDGGEVSAERREGGTAAGGGRCEWRARKEFGDAQRPVPPAAVPRFPAF